MSLPLYNIDIAEQAGCCLPGLTVRKSPGFTREGVPEPVGPAGNPVIAVQSFSAEE